MRWLAVLVCLVVPGVGMSETAVPSDTTVVQLSAQAERDVAQDKVKVTLRVEEEAETGQAVQSQVNRLMQQALNAAKGVPEVKATTGSYRVNKHQACPLARRCAESEYEQRWRAQQTLMLDSADSGALLKLTGRLQGMGMLMQGMQYYLSREKAEGIKDELIAEALDTVRSRAAKIANQLGKQQVHLVQINFGRTHMPQPQTLMQSRGEVAGLSPAMATPVGSGGDSRVGISVSVEVHLRP